MSSHGICRLTSLCQVHCSLYVQRKVQRLMAAWNHCPRRTLMVSRMCEHDLHICGVSNKAHLASVLVEPLLFWFSFPSLASPLLLLLQMTALTQALGKDCVHSHPHALWPRFCLTLQNCSQVQTICIWQFYECNFLHAWWQALDCFSQMGSHQTCISFCLLSVPRDFPGESSVCPSV